MPEPVGPITRVWPTSETWRFSRNGVEPVAAQRSAGEPCGEVAARGSARGPDQTAVTGSRSARLPAVDQRPADVRPAVRRAASRGRPRRRSPSRGARGSRGGAAPSGPGATPASSRVAVVVDQEHRRRVVAEADGARRGLGERPSASSAMRDGVAVDEAATRRRPRRRTASAADAGSRRARAASGTTSSGSGAGGARRRGGRGEASGSTSGRQRRGGQEVEEAGLGLARAAR